MNTKMLSWFSKTLFIFVIVLSITLFAPQKASAAGECYVKANASGANNGTSWANAYTGLQSALGPSPCTEVWVAAGTYKPTTGTYRGSSFTLKNGVALYGGFAGTETQRTERNPAVNVTILSGDLGATGNSTDNAYHVVVGGGANNTAVLDGFTITGGNANDTFPHDYGGGIYNNASSPTLANLIFTGNTAAIYGGGMSNNNSSSPVLTNVTFNSNTAAIYGGGMSNNNSSSPTMTNVIFSNNSAPYGGGGLYNSSGSNPTLMNVTFNGNSSSAATGYGGGMQNYSSSPTLTNITFSGNSASSCGGVYNDTSSSPTLTNVTISGNSTNSASSLGGGMCNNNNSSPTLTNVTFSGNSASTGGAIYNANSSNPQIKNSIFWGNSASVGNAEISNSISSPDIADSVVAGGCPSNTTCANILATDPLLGALANNGGFTQTIALSLGSSAINTGNDATCASTDQRGVARPQGPHCDMGAYELLGHTISGNAGVAEATLSYTDVVIKTTSADLNGDYSLFVTDGWSGTVTPSKLGWSFTPDHKDYANVIADQTSQDYSATRTGYVISGNAGLAGATLSYFDGTAKTALADGNGDYAFTVSLNWSGTVTPSKPGFNYTFTPPSRDYTNLSADQTDQDYTITLYLIYLPLVVR